METNINDQLGELHIDTEARTVVGKCKAKDLSRQIQSLKNLVGIGESDYCNTCSNQLYDHEERVSCMCNSCYGELMGDTNV